MTWVAAGLDLVSETDGTEFRVDLPLALGEDVPVWRLSVSLVEIETGHTETISGRFLLDPDEQPYARMLTRAIGRRPTRRHLDYLRGLRDACDRVLREHEHDHQEGRQA